jgi:hypothetical protein
LRSDAQAGHSRTDSRLRLASQLDISVKDRTFSPPEPARSELRLLPIPGSGFSGIMGSNVRIGSIGLFDADALV